MTAGDKDKRKAIYIAHRPALLAYARLLSGSRAEAEDLVQEAFIRFSPEHADTALSPRAYLVRIIRNLAFNLKKRRRYESQQASDNLPFWGRPQPVDTPEQHVLFGDQVRSATSILAAMSDDARTIVEMYRFDGYTLQEIADRLDLSVATVHRMLKTAMAELAERMDAGVG
ncbi:MAG TPA: RNA polymerase sigma factor [Ensifer sp.]|jgi:RNA polymerase sigma-70 factor (ECF subfamily)|uniref:RNA polymerase sigma factor n=1 Tax=Ensifer sp. TaxID=1872086 RepID=UPI002E0F12B0|nr:RNA polymerase sigma factor [Ensifer sp.]